VIGPLGKAFAYPRRLGTCLLIAEGHGGATMLFLAQELRERGKRVDMILGAGSEAYVFKPIEAKRVSQTIDVVTEDGSLGRQGSILDVLPRVAEETHAEVVYAAGPHALLRAVAAFCADRRTPAQVAVEEPMACGLGLCFTCVVPVIRRDGSGYDNLRSCTEGPVFNAARVFWDRWAGDAGGSVPTPPEGFPVVGSWPG
jgi:dihydroorotate dehydrogenase electron transfer subunit